MIKVSIIVPVFNAALYIERCMDSVMDQTYPFIECILVDDCTPDQSMLLIDGKLKNYAGEKEFKIIAHLANLGAAAARNTGLRQATGDYIYFLDSDDLIYPDCIGSLINLVNRFPYVDMVLGDMVCEDPLINKVFTMGHKKFPAYSNDRYWIHDNFLINIPISPCNKLLRFELVSDNHLYFREGIVNEDVLWVFFLSKYVRSIGFCKEKTYYYHYNEGSVTTSAQNEWKRTSSWLVVLDTYLENIDPQVKWMENLSLLKLFHHVSLCQVSKNHKHSFESGIKKRLTTVISNRHVPLPFKAMYLLLFCPKSIIKKGRFFWNKCIGGLYRLSMRQDRHVMKQKLLNQKKQT